MLFYCAYALSKLPLPFLHGLARWLLYPIMYYVVRYRRSIVRANLRSAFPDYSQAQLRRIERTFYRRFCDTIVEIIYGISCSDTEMKQRVVFENMDCVNQLVTSAGGGIFMLAHMGNWEWMASVQQWLKPGVTELNIYRQQKNKAMDHLMLAVRSKRGGKCVEKQRILREMVQYRAERKPITLGLLSDQKPRPQVTRTWLTFLHRETGFLDGGEVLGRKFGYPVFYAFITSPKRGHYHVQMIPIAPDPKSTSDGQITTLYARELERNIIAQPELWLWTHNRWKWNRPNPNE